MSDSIQLWPGLDYYMRRRENLVSISDEMSSHETRKRHIFLIIFELFACYYSCLYLFFQLVLLFRPFKPFHLLRCTKEAKKRKRAKHFDITFLFVHRQRCRIWLVRGSIANRLALDFPYIFPASLLLFFFSSSIPLSSASPRCARMRAAGGIWRVCTDKKPRAVLFGRLP